MSSKQNRPKIGEELWRANDKEIAHSTIKMVAGSALTPGNWLVYDSKNMPREIKHDGTKWVIINEN